MFTSTCFSLSKRLKSTMSWTMLRMAYEVTKLLKKFPVCDSFGYNFVNSFTAWST